MPRGAFAISTSIYSYHAHRQSSEFKPNADINDFRIDEDKLADHCCKTRVRCTSRTRAQCNARESKIYILRSAIVDCRAAYDARMTSVCTAACVLFRRKGRVRSRCHPFDSTRSFILYRMTFESAKCEWQPLYSVSIPFIDKCP